MVCLEYGALLPKEGRKKTRESSKDRQLVKLWHLLKNLGMKKSTRRQVKVEKTVTSRERQQEQKLERRQYHKKSCQAAKPTSRNLCWLHYTRVRTGQNTHTHTYMHVHIHRALFASLRSLTGICCCPAERCTVKGHHCFVFLSLSVPCLCISRYSPPPPLFFYS